MTFYDQVVTQSDCQVCYTSIGESAIRHNPLYRYNNTSGTKKAVSRLSFLFAETVKINIKPPKYFIKTIDITYTLQYNYKCNKCREEVRKWDVAEKEKLPTEVGLNKF